MRRRGAQYVKCYFCGNPIKKWGQRRYRFESDWESRTFYLSPVGVMGRQIKKYFCRHCYGILEKIENNFYEKDKGRTNFEGTDKYILKLVNMYKKDPSLLYLL